MSVLSDDVYLDQFGTWLADLGKDVGALAELLRVNAEHESAKSIAGGLNYVFKSLDLIPDGIDDLGYLDDAFVLRVAALHARQAGLTGEALERLAGQVETLRTFLAQDFDRLESYVASLQTGSARGRSVEQILGDSALRSSFLGELQIWSEQYQAPGFTKHSKTLVKLKAFLSAKLP
jgi:uncharacterized membrane protein YkvA (DUF1232 family)